MPQLTIFIFVVFVVIWVLSQVIKSMQDNTPNKPPVPRARPLANNRNTDEQSARPQAAPQRPLNATNTNDNDRFRSEIDRLRQRRDARNAPAPAVASAVPPTVTPAVRPPMVRRANAPAIRPPNPARNPLPPPVRPVESVRPNFLAQIENTGANQVDRNNSQPTQPSFSVGPPKSHTGPQIGNIVGSAGSMVTTVVATQGTTGAVAIKATLGTGVSSQPTAIVALVQKLLSDPASLGAAILLTEVLGRPVSKRTRSRGSRRSI